MKQTNKIGIIVKAEFNGYANQVDYDVNFVTKKNGKIVPLFLYNFEEQELQSGFEWSSGFIDINDEFCEYKYGLKSLIDDREKYKDNKDAYEFLCRLAKEIEEGSRTVFLNYDYDDELDEFYEKYADELNIDSYIVQDLRDSGLDEAMFEVMDELFSTQDLKYIEQDDKNEDLCWYNIPDDSRIYCDYWGDMRMWNEVA